MALTVGLGADPADGRAWRLGTADVVRALCDVALEVGPDADAAGDAVLERVASACDGRPCELAPSDVAALDDRWGRARSALARLGRDGVGVVDLDGGGRRGLAAGWSPAALAGPDGVHVLVADGSRAVTLDGAGLHLLGAPGGSSLALVGATVDVGEAGGATVTLGDVRHEVGAEAGALLAAVVPGVRRWRARHVPEVVTWADALAAASEAARVARVTAAPAVVGPAT